MPGDVQPRQLDAVLEEQPRLGRHPGRRGEYDRGRLGSGLNGREAICRQREHLIGVNVPRQRERRVSRPVVGLEERPHVVQARGADVLRAADRHPVIRVVRRVQRAHERHAREAVRPVLVVLTALVQDDLALVLELRVRQRGQQVPHPIGFHPERQLERVARHDLPVVRAVGVRRPVQQGPGLLERLEVAVIVVLRALEHQVLEEVRKPGAPGRLVLRSHVIPEVDRDDRTGMIFVDQDVEAVLETMMGIGNVHIDSGAPELRTGIITRESCGDHTS